MQVKYFVGETLEAIMKEYGKWLKGSEIKRILSTCSVIDPISYEYVFIVTYLSSVFEKP